MVASGYGVWLSWKGTLNSAVENTLREYGVLLLAQEEGQSLWFCHTPELFRALARLQMWARVNPMPVLCQVVPMTFLVGYNMDFSASLSAELDRQDSRVSEDFEVLIHPKIKDKVKSVPGLSTIPVGSVDGLASVEWLGLQVDQGLDYETVRKWYFIIKPLGKMSDQDSFVGWRDFSSHILALVQRLGLKYVSDVKEGAIFFPLDNFQLLKNFCIEILTLIRETKEDPDLQVWPVVMAAVSQERLQFTQDLPKKVGLDWNRLTPDYPHVRFMDGFLLSHWFKVNEARYGTEALSLDSWCTIAQREGGAMVEHGTMEIMLPDVLAGGDGTECFYCGQKNHVSGHCPSRSMAAVHPQVWHLLSKVDVKEINSALAVVDAEAGNGNFASAIRAIMERKNDLSSLLVRAMYEINVPAQIRMLKLVWRSRSKEWADGFRQLAPVESGGVWEALNLMEAADSENAEELLKAAQLKSPRNYQPHSLMGFIQLERNDTNQAMFNWQEAERLSYTSLQQGYFAYLQARLDEVGGTLKEAINGYKRASSHSPGWIDPVYRQAVCMIKMGFTGQAMDLFSDLIRREPHIFNRVLLDPELDRGRVQIMSSLWEMWSTAAEEMKQASSQVEALVKDIERRFNENHDYYESANEELERLNKLSSTNNYVAFRMLASGTNKFQTDLDDEVRREIKRINANLEYQAERIRSIQKEAAWFPFPKLLLEFNKDFNFCVDKINWIKTQNLKDADNFRKALAFMEQVEDRIDTLQGRLVTLRIVRDSTLFVLMLGRNFIWLELICLGLALVGVPGFIYFTQDVQGNWIVDALREQRWEFAKGLVIILSVLSIAFAAIKSGLTFEKRKRELFNQLDDERRSSAPRRY
ncbi:tetratricopeptide repeat protein [Pseudodesulfovibrio sp.]|uniref:tetratricopeptide repeat protein n=1 Tax=unclassified Pseudodesulfovibrio TaxID=2661612 RepID=UPI003AFF7B63